jgi:hypothetical protein
MVALIPLLSLFSLTLVVRRLLVNKKLLVGWPQVILLAGVLWGLWLTLTTEILSLFKGLEFYTVLGSWCLLLLWSLWIIYRFPQNWLEKPRVLPLPLSLRILSGIIILIMATSGMVALVSPPNNWDSMTYHLSRVMHWIQNQSVAHYSTHEIRQLYLGPWAEFAVMHLQILSNSDRFANMVQWLSMVGSVLGASFIARQLGANLSGQVLAALVTATIPMGILQAVTTQTDYVVSFWLVCLVSFILLAAQNLNWLYVLGIAGSLGLAVLTKATAYIFAAPFLLWFCVLAFKTYRWQVWKSILTIGILVLLVNGGHYYRNLQLFGSPLGPRLLGENPYANQVFTPATFISNVVRHMASHVNTPVLALKAGVEGGVQRLHNLLGLDVSDPRITWAGMHFGVTGFVVNEDLSGNFAHLVLILLALAGLTGRKFMRKRDLLFTYALLVTAAFLLFAFYLKWQPWISRLHLPLFVLWSPVVGVLLARLPARPISSITALLLIVQALPFLLQNPFHPVIGQENIFNLSRSEQYFLRSPDLREPYLVAAELITAQKCRQVGLIMPPESWEYPFWALLHQPQDMPVQIEDLEVDNITDVLQESEKFEPCAVICLKCKETQKILYTQKIGPPLSSGPNYLFIKR